MRRITAILLAAALLFSSLSVHAEESSDEALLSELERSADISTVLRTEGSNITTVITEPFYEGVMDEDSAIAALESVFDRLGGDDSTQLILQSVYSTDELTYYTFRQIVGDILVETASVKLIVNEEGTAVCAVSSLKADLGIEIQEAEELTAEQAELAVDEAIRGTGASILKEMSHQAVVEIEGENRLVWVVYTDNPFEDLDVGFLAHYVNDRGEVIGNVPIVTPFSSDEESNSFAELAFLGMEPDVWSGEVTLYDGTTRSLTVPIMTDEEGNAYLGDVQRKILCADYSAWESNHDLEIRRMKDGRFDDGELLTYESIIRVWDFYQEIGWEGADGKGTPILLKMDLVDEDGDPIHNAYYGGKENGFQCFAFNRDERDGETLDIIGHEFTHCVTTVLSVNAPYRNDSGAINEALSDIMGNLMEEMLDASEDPDWLIGEAAKNPDQILRCMSNPHLYHQPEFVWDQYYCPAVGPGPGGSDYGGVHANSSLLSLIAWRLHEAGMEPEDEFDYMMTVILTMTGTISYPEMAILLPWCLEQVKMEKYMDALNAAIEETGIEQYIPSRYPEGCALVMADVSADAYRNLNNLTLDFLYEDEEGEIQSISTWPDARLESVLIALPAGNYLVTLDDLNTEQSWILGDEGWIEVTGIPVELQPDPTVIAFEENEFYELPDIVLEETETEDAA